MNLGNQSVDNKANIPTPIIIHKQSDELFLKANQLCNTLGLSYDELILLQKQLSNLQSYDQYIDNFTFSDFDDTLVSRIPQLEEDIFLRNRGPAGNEVVKSKGLKNFIKSYYDPKLLVNAIREETNAIITAGSVELQNAKVQQVGMFDLDTIVVPKLELKPKELLFYILFTLRKIPRNIVFYDDKIDKLDEHLSLVSEFLNNDIIAHKVYLDENNPNTIKKLDTTRYSAGDNITLH